MQWMHEYQLFLFDLDGLLVNTEEIHYLAYKRIFADRGFDLDWDFAEYCQAAHYESDGFKQKIYAKFQDLREVDTRWDVLYAEKRRAMLNLLRAGAVHLMPGVEPFLLALERANIARCVVTHSPDDQVQIIRDKNPILNSIPNWFTREHYSHPKPDPECYQKAILKFAKEQDKVIGFEDSPRGLRALLGTRAKPVLVTKVPYPEIPAFKRRGVLHRPDFNSMLDALGF